MQRGSPERATAILEAYVSGVRNGPALLLRPTGPLDADSCGALRHQLAAAFAAGVTSVGVDLSEVTTVDLAGLGVLSGAARHLRKRGGNLIVIHPNEQVLSKLHINDLSDLLDMQPSPSLRLVAGAGAGSPTDYPRTLSSVPALKRLS